MKRQHGKDFAKQQHEEELGGDDKADRTRVRNREHARKTRLRKKDTIEGMKMRILELQREVNHQFNSCSLPGLFFFLF
jgi:hypothetical protein